MTSRNNLCSLAGLLFAGLFVQGSRAQDELGLGKMWTFERPPLAYLEREYGWKPDERWWNTVRLASLRFGRGCSASFVSPQGLILTNHHCARDAVAQVQGNNDWVRDGFVARELADEVRLPGLTVQQLIKMTDVTSQMAEGIAGDATAERAENQREANRGRILAAARQRDPGLEPQLVKLFQGGIWQLYQYRIFGDVRLVMSPHLQASHFGGDPDNFVYPRYALDFAFCRAYVDGKPADTAAMHLPWGDGPEPGALVILTGNPGSTQRLLTKAQLEYQRDARYPRVREQIDNRIEILRRFSATSPEMEKRHRTTILGLENGQKLYRGEHAALLDAQFMSRKEAAEKSFQARAAKSGSGNALAVWQQLETLMVRKKALEAPLNFHTAGGLPLLLRAFAVLDFAKTGDAETAQKARDVDCKEDPVQFAFFVDHLERARNRLPKDDVMWKVGMSGEEPLAFGKRLVGDSRLGERAFLDELLAGGADPIQANKDPALQFARVLAPLQAEHQRELAAVNATEAQLDAEIAKLLFAVYGNDVSPDATFTLRFSDGRVRGYAYNGTLAPWRTVFHGLFARAAEFDGVHPFDLPEPFRLAAGRIDMETSLNFVCTVDSTGGNSGSPVIDQHGRLVGLLFDGNVESFANEFLYGERVERSVCVHPDGIVESLRKVYRATRLLREIAR